MRGLAQTILKFSHTLNILEWMVVIAIVVMPIMTIRVLPMFYIGLTTLGLIVMFGVIAVWDYQHTRYKKQRAKKAQHYGLVALYIFGGWLISWLYLIG